MRESVGREERERERERKGDSFWMRGRVGREERERDSVFVREKKLSGEG